MKRGIPVKELNVERGNVDDTDRNICFPSSIIIAKNHESLALILFWALRLIRNMHRNLVDFY